MRHTNGYVNTVTFNGKTYKTKSVQIPNWGWCTIGSSSLEDALMQDGKYVSDEARVVDEGIFYYVDDARFNRYTSSELVEVVEREVS